MADLVQNIVTVREMPWWAVSEEDPRLTMLSDWEDPQRVMELAGHAHRIVERPILSSPAPGKALSEIGSHKALYRDDTNQPVSVMPASYVVVQNEVPWSIVCEIGKQAAGRALVKTAGILEGSYARNTVEGHSGEKIQGAARGTVYWVLVQLKSEDGDENYWLPFSDYSPYQRYVLATWSHDGTQSLRIKETDVMVVCANTQAAALSGTGKEYLDLSFKHTKKVGDRVQEAQRALQFAERSHRAFVELATELAGMAISEEGVREFVERLIPMPLAAPGTVISDRVAHNIEEARGAVWAILNGGTTVPEHLRNTGFGLQQAAFEYLQHVRRYRSKNVFFKRSVLSVDAQQKAVVPLIREIAKEYAA